MLIALGQQLAEAHGEAHDDRDLGARRKVFQPFGAQFGGYLLHGGRPSPRKVFLPLPPAALDGTRGTRLTAEVRSAAKQAFARLESGLADYAVKPGKPT